MTPAQIKKKLDRMVRIGNELDAEAKRRFGSEALLFHEAGGSLLIMDSLPESGNKNDHVKFSSDGIASWGAGAF